MFYLIDQITVLLLYLTFERIFHRFLNTNHLVSLPEGVFSNLTNLEWFFLDDNRLIDFDLNEFSALINLRWLNLSYNDLHLRDAVFPNLTKLNELWVIFYIYLIYTFQIFFIITCFQIMEVLEQIIYLKFIWLKRNLHKDYYLYKNQSFFSINPILAFSICFI